MKYRLLSVGLSVLLSPVLALAEEKSAPTNTKSIKESPRVLPPATAGVSKFIPESTLKNLAGEELKLSQLVGKNGLVIAMTNTTCPICGKYGPTLTTLEKWLNEQGVNVLFINPTANEKPEQMKAFVAKHQLKSPYVHDADGAFSKRLGVTTTAEVLFLDRQRTVIYRGAIDDQYGLGYTLEAPKNQFLMQAVTAVLAKRRPDPAATTAPGCELDLSSAKVAATNVTYHNRISRIIRANCEDCHRKGGVGPFALSSYEDVTAHAAMIRKVVDQGTMPPWFATAAPQGHRSPWANDRTVSVEDKSDLLAWLKSDRPLGNAADAPLPRDDADGWMIGKPDAVYQFAKPVAVKATGTMPYQNVVVDTKLDSDRWVKSIEIRPTAPGVVHHVLVFALAPGDANNDDELHSFFGAYVPGQSVFTYPAEYAKKLPKGARLRFQMHYTPNGTATQDQTRIGIVFADQPPQYEVRVAGLANTRIAIPAGAANHPEVATLRLPSQVTILGFMPHMHLRGKAFRYEILQADGKAETILDIPAYDFNWQLYYRLAEPRSVTAGMSMKATGWFDNSDKNPANPDAKKVVRWGPQTTDEMMLGYVEYIVPVGTKAEMPKRPRLNVDQEALFKRVDTNADGKISREEYDTFIKIIPRLKNNPDEAKQLFERLDANSDQVISVEEFKKLGM